MKEPKFDFNQEGVTLEWMQEGSTIGYIRIHTGDVPNSPVSHSCAIELYQDKTFEFKIMKKEMEGNYPFRDKLTPLTQYLHSIGYVGGGWGRRDKKKLKETSLSDKYLKNEDSKE